MKEQGMLHNIRTNTLVMMRTLVSLSLTPKLTMLMMAGPVKMTVGRVTLKAILPRCTQCQLRSKPSWRPPSALEKIGFPDTKWTKTPVLPPLMASILPKETVKEDKRTFRTQQSWLEAAASLVSLLETAYDDKLDPKIAVTMVQSTCC